MSKDMILKYSVQLEEKSKNTLADYAYVCTKKIKQEETFRTEIRRERDKILYTGGFRRLQDKTQVMPSILSGDHRTRLTHTLEVEQIAVSVANALSLNSDLVSAIALGHDIGHTPFGHAGEHELNYCLRNYGGFHHPLQSLKYIWSKYGDKIVDEIYEGIILHDSDMFTIDKSEARQQLEFLSYKGKEQKEKDKENLEKFLSFLRKIPSTLEAQVVVWADKIAYITHDLEDFLKSSVYDSIKNNDKKGQEIEKKLFEILSVFLEKDKNIESISDFEQRDLIRKLTTDLIETSFDKIKSICLKDENGDFKNFISEEINIRCEEVNKSRERKKRLYLDNLIINFSDEIRVQYYELRRFLDDNYISSPEIQRSDANAKKIIFSLFDIFSKNYKLLPLNIRTNIDELLVEKGSKMFSVEQKINNIKVLEKLEKNSEEYKKYKKSVISKFVVSYIATMTDKYAKNLLRKLDLGDDYYL